VAFPRLSPVSSRAMRRSCEMGESSQRTSARSTPIARTRSGKAEAGTGSVMGRVTRSRQCRTREAECPRECCGVRPNGSGWRAETLHNKTFLARAHRTPLASRMLRGGYMSQISYHFLAMADQLAQLLHCVRESDACPICVRADADSRPAPPSVSDLTVAARSVPSYPRVGWGKAFCLAILI
jgi:hypothetical protein